MAVKRVKVADNVSPSDISDLMRGLVGKRYVTATEQSMLAQRQTPGGGSDRGAACRGRDPLVTTALFSPGIVEAHVITADGEFWRLGRQAWSDHFARTSAYSLHHALEGPR